MSWLIRFCALVSTFVFFLIFIMAAKAAGPIIIGLDADMSSGSARSGQSIKRGAELAIYEINKSGGVLGRNLKLQIRDHRGNPSRGVDNIVAFSGMTNVVAVIGGLHTPVALHELEAIHTNKMLYLGPWAAGTPIVKNGYQPNYVFRVSVRDEFAGGYLVEQALKRGHKRIALLLENTGWGRSNERAMKKALYRRDMNPAGLAWFHWGPTDIQAALVDLEKSQPDVILLVANAPEGLALIRAMAKRPKDRRIPILSHWGISGGEFASQAKNILNEVDLLLLQTFSFLDPVFPEKSDKFVTAYTARYPNVFSARDIIAPVGAAHAFDLVYLLAKAIEKAGTIDRPAVRDAMENLDKYNGLVRVYDPAFTATRHDALDVEDFRMARFAEDGTIVPQ
ncbi:MAG: ABC transporter substrate-binding protein [Hyphomicrobiales bacterium]|nr:MAG: ABC transporter substrate-binding protein [Hyphomicrobiales bacterium]